MSCNYPSINKQPPRPSGTPPAEGNSRGVTKDDENTSPPVEGGNALALTGW